MNQLSAPVQPTQAELVDLLEKLWRIEQVLKTKGVSLEDVIDHASKSFFGASAR